MSLPVSPSGTTCPNCGGVLERLFCSGCGQRANRPDCLADLAQEWWDRVFGREAILWSTLQRLAFSPGGLTIDWWEGRRAAIMSPVRTVLVVLFLTTALATLQYLVAPDADVDVGRLVAVFTYQLVGVGTLACLSVLRRLLPKDRQRTDYQIATFALYEGAFFALLVSAFVLCMLLSALVPILALLVSLAPAVPLILGLVGLGHPTLHLKTAFGLSWVGAVARMLVIAPVTFIMMMVVSALLSATGVADLWGPKMREGEFGAFHKVPAP